MPKLRRLIAGLLHRGKEEARAPGDSQTQDGKEQPICCPPDIDSTTAQTIRRVGPWS